MPVLDPATISLDDQITELKRELRVRATVYAKWVADKKMTPQVADRQTARMQAALNTLLSLLPKPLL
jgi:hypothetical protein